MLRKGLPKKPDILTNSKRKTPGVGSELEEQNSFLMDIYEGRIKGNEEEIKYLKKELQEKNTQLNLSAAEIERLKKELKKHKGDTADTWTAIHHEHLLSRPTKDNAYLKNDQGTHTKEQNESEDIKHLKEELKKERENFAAEIERLKKELTKQQGTPAGLL